MGSGNSSTIKDSFMWTLYVAKCVERKMPPSIEDTTTHAQSFYVFNFHQHFGWVSQFTVANASQSSTINLEELFY